MLYTSTNVLSTHNCT